MENNKITVPLEVSAGEAMAERDFWHSQATYHATHRHLAQLEIERLQQIVEVLQSEKQLQQAEIDRLTARINAPQMPIIIEDEGEDNGE